MVLGEVYPRIAFSLIINEVLLSIVQIELKLGNGCLSQTVDLSTQQPCTDKNVARIIVEVFKADQGDTFVGDKVEGITRWHIHI